MGAPRGNKNAAGPHKKSGYKKLPKGYSYRQERRNKASYLRLVKRRKRRK